MLVVRADLLIQLAEIVVARDAEEATAIRKQALELYRAKGNVAALSRYEVDARPRDIRDYAG
jgi:hypothetical protein